MVHLLFFCIYYIYLDDVDISPFNYFKDFVSLFADCTAPFIHYKADLIKFI